MEGRTRETHPDASLGCFCIAITDTGHAVGFFVEKHHVGDVAQLGAFLADVLLDVEDSSRIFLQRSMVSAVAESDGRAGPRRFILITSNSASVNMCFRITTLSQRELVSGRAEGSSSSQSASLLLTYVSVKFCGHSLGDNSTATYLFSFCVFLMIFCLSLLLLLFAGASFCVL